MEVAMIKVVPIVSLILIGYLIRIKKLMSQEEMGGLKKLVINYALPAVLLSVFLELDLKPSHMGITLVLMSFCITLLLTGFLIRHLKPSIGRAFPYILPGFSFGLLGIAFYITAFPNQPVAEYAVFGIGHELFIWMILITVMRIDLGGEPFNFRTLLSLFRSPLILAVIIGLTLNLLGFMTFIQDNFVAQSLYKSVEMLKSVGTPIILIFSGYGLVFDKIHMKKALIYLSLRRIFVYSIGFVFLHFAFPMVTEVTATFDASWFMFMMIGPPLSLAMFVGLYGTQLESELINNGVVLDTVLSIITYIVMMFIIN